MNIFKYYYYQYSSLLFKIFLIVATVTSIIAIFLHQFGANRPILTDEITQENRTEIYKVINNPDLNKTKEGQFAISMYRKGMCSFVGEGCTNNPDDGDKNFDGSLLGQMSNLIAFPLAARPASGLYWAYSGMENAGMAPTIHAQGIGFAAIQPLSTVWKIFRDLTYMLLVIIIVVIGFMIMFRFKISSQAVITIESAIPRIVIALLLITFSFAIAGFLIDVMYIIMGMSLNLIIGRTPPEINTAKLDTLGRNLYGDGWGTLFTLIVGNANIKYSGSALLSLLPYGLQVVFRFIVGMLVMLSFRFIEPLNNLIKGLPVSGIPFIGGLAATAVGAFIWPIIFGLIFTVFMPLILSFFVFVTALLVYFRIFFLLFSTYTQIILLIIFAPIILIFEAIPGRGTFGFWFKTLFVYLLTFPIVAILIAVSTLVINIGRETDLWKAPFLYTRNTSGFVVLVGLSIIFLIPDLVKLVRGFFGVKGLGINVSAGTFVGGSAVAIGGVLGLAHKVHGIQASLVGANPGHGILKGAGDLWRKFVKF